jgi:carboxylesterase
VQLRAYADTSIDIAAGLGERVHVIGISAGAVIAGWIAQNRREIDRAVLISPAYGLHSLGTSLNNTLMRLTLLLPNFSVWNDPIHKSTGAGRPHSYMRQSTRSIGEVMRLGLATLRQATATPAASRSITIITNAADTVVDLTMPDQLAKQWEQHATPVTRFTFAKELALPHEMIDPTQEGARTSISYPKIIELAERSPEATDARPRKADV